MLFRGFKTPLLSVSTLIHIFLHAIAKIRTISYKVTIWIHVQNVYYFGEPLFPLSYTLSPSCFRWRQNDGKLMFTIKYIICVEKDKNVWKLLPWGHQWSSFDFLVSVLILISLSARPLSVCHFNSEANSLLQTSRWGCDQRVQEGDRESIGVLPGG